MAYSDFMDVLGRLHKLTPAQRRAVAEVLAEPEEVSEPVAASETVAKPAKLANHCRPFSPEEREETLGFAWAYIESPSSAGRRKIYRDAAAKMGRSLESVKKAIRIARRELEGRKPKGTK
jgi:hypothetical protein